MPDDRTMVESEPSAAVPSRPWLMPTAALERFQASHALNVRAALQEPIVRFGCRVGTLGLLVAAGTLSEVIIQPAIYPVPTSPPWLAGLMNLRGNLVPAFDLHLALDISESQAKSKRTLLILDRGEAAVGFFIDGLPQTVDTQHRMRQLPPIPTLLQDHVRQAYMENGCSWVEFDHASFFMSLGEQLSA